MRTIDNSLPTANQITATPISKTYTGFALVVTVETKETREGAAYLQLLLGDRSGQVAGVLWDMKDQDVEGIEVGSLVKVRGVMGEWQGKKQLRIQKIRLSQSTDDLDASDFVKSAPESGESMLAYVHTVVDQVVHPQIRTLLKRILGERQEDLLIAPAATRNHHAVRCGLLYHITTMLRAGLALLEVYPFLNKDLVIAGVVLHDLAKLDELVVNPLGMASEYSREGTLLGHLVMGVMDIDRLGREIGLDREMALLLEHMVLSHHYEPEFGSPTRPAFPEAELLHFLDILDARLYDMKQLIDTVDPGSFSDRIWRLDNRKVYRPKETRPG
ncbi:MAG: OB-fold nucleic acid binding domain-containing protein [Peptococcaceae bacterium]|nr:OB-fold nucleic acid binding domain-containing protein [Peptococcaceae bacterium]